MAMLVVGVSFASAQTNADIKFDKTTHDFGTFSENSPVVNCEFTFTNIGDAPLVIHQAVAPVDALCPNIQKSRLCQVKKERSKSHTTEQESIRDISKSQSLYGPTPKLK